MAFCTTQPKDNVDNIALLVFKLSLLRSHSGRDHAMLTRGVGEHCVTPGWAASKETNSNLEGKEIRTRTRALWEKSPSRVSRALNPIPFQTPATEANSNSTFLCVKFAMDTVVLFR